MESSGTYKMINRLLIDAKSILYMHIPSVSNSSIYAYLSNYNVFDKLLKYRLIERLFP